MVLLEECVAALYTKNKVLLALQALSKMSGLYWLFHKKHLHFI